MNVVASSLGAGWLPAIPVEVMAQILEIPRWMSRRLFSDPTPRESQRELFRDAIALHKAGLTDSQMEEFLRVKFADYYREITPREFERAIERSKDADLIERSAPQYPSRNAETVADVLAKNEGNVVTLKTLSPTPHPGEIPSGAVIDTLFPGGGLLCLAASLASAVTRRREEFCGLEHDHQFMVPNLMTAEFGFTQDNRRSPRTNANVGPQTFQVIEFDQGTLDEQARIHLYLRSLGVPLAMVVFSGGKSLHGWYNQSKVGGVDRSRFRQFAAALGADRATFVPCQLVRTPTATRDGVVKQEVLFLHPEAGR